MPILNDLAVRLEPVREEHAVLVRLYGEVMWLRQEIAKGTVRLPLRSTRDLNFPYALSEGMVDPWPEIRERLEALYEAMFEEVG
jgi:hypothetical protein